MDPSAAITNQFDEGAMTMCKCIQNRLKFIPQLCWAVCLELEKRGSRGQTCAHRCHNYLIMRAACGIRPRQRRRYADFLRLQINIGQSDVGAFL